MNTMLIFIPIFIIIFSYYFTFKEIERKKEKRNKYVPPIFRTSLNDMHEMGLTIKEINNFTAKIHASVLIDGLGRSVNGKIKLD